MKLSEFQEEKLFDLQKVVDNLDDAAQDLLDLLQYMRNDKARERIYKAVKYIDKAQKAVGHDSGLRVEG